jgi:hypothetical protein
LLASKNEKCVLSSTDLPSNTGLEIIAPLKDELKTCTKRTEQVQILTDLPQNWSEGQI